MHDMHGRTLNVGDQIYTARYGICTITFIRADTSYMTAHQKRGEGRFRYSQDLYSKDMPESFRIRTLRELAQEALAVQNASNLSGVVISFGSILRELRLRLEFEEKPNGTDDINSHPVSQLFSDKIASMTGSQNDEGTIHSAYGWAYDTTKDS